MKREETSGSFDIRIHAYATTFWYTGQVVGKSININDVSQSWKCGINSSGLKSMVQKKENLA